MARERVVFNPRVSPPERGRDLAIADRGTGPLGEGVQEDVLVRRKPYVVRP